MAEKKSNISQKEENRGRKKIPDGVHERRIRFSEDDLQRLDILVQMYNDELPIHLVGENKTLDAIGKNSALINFLIKEKFKTLSENNKIKEFLQLKTNRLSDL